MFIKSRKSSGFTLVELMIATTISLLVIVAAVSIYISIKNQYAKYSNKHEINTKKLLVEQIFSNSISQIGYSSNYIDKPKLDNTSDNYNDIFSQYGALSVGRLPVKNVISISAILENDFSSCITSQGCFQDNTDFLMIQKSTKSTTLSEVSSNNAIKLNNFYDGSLAVDNFNLNDYAVLCNVDFCQLNKVANLSNNLLETANRVDNSFYKNDYAGIYVLEIYYIKDSKRLDVDGNKVYSLYKYVKNGSSAGSSYELVSDVSNLEIFYATDSDIDTTNGNIAWKRAPDLTYSIDNGNLKGIRIDFNIDGEPFSKVYVFNTN